MQEVGYKCLLAAFAFAFGWWLKKRFRTFFSAPPLLSSLGYNNQLANLQQFPATLSSTP
jgi:hypothetical protein